MQRLKTNLNMIGINCNIIFNIFPNEVHASKFYCHKSLLQSIGSENTTMHSLFRRALSGLGIDLDLRLHSLRMHYTRYQNFVPNHNPSILGRSLLIDGRTWFLITSAGINLPFSAASGADGIPKNTCFAWTVVHVFHEFKRLLALPAYWQSRLL